ncbi:MAG TPA: polysaccharide biosynthesis tyrosine autokinase [Crocinitomix sp.]|nr:polysaccharide biosynthesis tyrosine autokinase [Crocinitomix sp.]
MENKQHNNRSNLNKDFDLDIAKSVIKRNWISVPIIIGISLVLAFIYLRYSKPLYESSALIQRTSKDEGKRILEIDGFSQELNLQEDVELLKSTFLLEKALKNLNLKISYFSEGKILTEEKYLQSPYHITLFELKDSSLIGKKIEVTGNIDKVTLSFPNSNYQPIEIIPSVPFENNWFSIEFKVNDKTNFLKNLKENKNYFIFNDYKALTQKLHENLNVFVVNNDAKTIRVSYKSNNAALARDVVSSLINTFFKYDLDKKSESSASVLRFIDEQLDTVFNQLRLSELDIQNFRDNSQSRDPDYLKTTVIAQLDLLQNQLINSDLEYELLKDINLGVNSRSRMEVYNLIPAISGTRFQNILSSQIEKLHELLEKKEDASYGMTEENDNLKRINRNIEIQIQTINRTIESVKKQIKNKRVGLKNKIAELESKLYGVPAKEMELSRLKRKFSLNEKYYSLLIEKRTQYEISKAGYTMDNLILQAPSASQLISPNKKLVYVGAFVMSLLISFLFMGFKYITFNVIHNESELKKLLPYNVGLLGGVPKVNKVQDNSVLMIHKSPKSILPESFRSIRTNLQFILDYDKSNVIAVSSSISGEGKTFIALNLAGIFSLSGKKVVVLDLDLRKPKLHLGFNANNIVGMSSILAGKAEWKNCLQHSEIEGLDFISAGIIPPAPSELIINGKIDDLIKELKQLYDIIIIDNPPVGIVSDGINILNNADCALYVFRANYSKRMFANRVRELLDENKVKHLYTILNSVDLNKSSYGYGYGYGGYYEDSQTKPKKKLFSFLRKK